MHFYTYLTIHKRVPKTSHESEKLRVFLMVVVSFLLSIKQDRHHSGKLINSNLSTTGKILSMLFFTIFEFSLKYSILPDLIELY